ncbi:S8 family peptidase [bacterium]|nr:S8 family peptidase [bacterium]
MKPILISILLLLAIPPCISFAGEVYWIYFMDKGFDSQAEIERIYDGLKDNLTEKALFRRQKVMNDNLCDEYDLPVNQSYIDCISNLGVNIRVVSKYLNAVSAELEAPLKLVIESLDFVEKVEPVVLRKPSVIKDSEPSNQRFPADSAFYGLSYHQAAMVNLPPVHEMGYDGAGVLIGSCDAGWNNLEHICFSQLDLLAAWDFVNGDSIVDDEEGQAGEGSHGTKTLSVVAGYDPGGLVGPAYAAQYVLAKTENTDFERPIEEDWWVAGVEWMDSIGVDVISSSVSYSDWYSYEDLDGWTAVTSIAANIAFFEHGIVMVNSMGNDGSSSYPNNKMNAPADAPGVISCGALEYSGVRASYSSMGPTYDGRIKPDGMAQGSSVRVASIYSLYNYQSGSGTSFSCPMTAGICALLLQANPQLTPQQVIDIMHTTASQSANPDTLNGWGIWDALAAVEMALDYLYVDSRSLIPVNLSLNAYPNPFNSRIRIIASGIYDELEVSIYNIFGQKVESLILNPGDPAVYWKPEGKAAGVYLISAPGCQGLERKVLYLK